jgi:2-octaprenyl-6-methoxyphenol hydroxylase
MNQNHSTAQPLNRSTITIIGAGMVGLAQAIALAAKGIAVTVIDHEDPAKILSHQFDGRVSAIAWRSSKFLQKMGAWEAMLPHAEPIKDIRVSEFGSNLFLHFDHEEIGQEPFGFIIENRFIREALFKRAGELPNLKLIAPAKVLSIADCQITIEDKNRQSAIIDHQLLIGADGKNSSVRKAACIGEYRKSYKQMGIVATIEHEKPHLGLAHEHFMPVGPFAVLPLQNNRSSLVWTEPNDIAHIYHAMSDTDFLKQINKRVQYLGEIQLVSQRWIYPLDLMHADTYIKDNIVLIGDAAHAIHPIAGQGVNLGFRDAQTLAGIIYDQTRLGLDPASSIALEKYNSLRRLDNSIMIAATDRLNILFSNKILPLKLVRTLGLGAVNQIPPLKKLFMKYASGRLGN